MKFVRVVAPLLLVGLAFGVLGCGGQSRAGSQVTAAVTSNNVKLEDTDSISVVLASEGSEPAASGSGNPKSQPFALGHEDKLGVLPGKYKVAVKITPYPGMNAKGRSAGIDALNKKYDLAATPLTYEVTSDGEQSIVVDLDAGTVAKK